MSDRPLSARALGKRIGVAHTTILEWYQKGVISACIHEGRTIRFDEAEVRETLRKRAIQAQKERQENPHGLGDLYVPTC